MNEAPSQDRLDMEGLVGQIADEFTERLNRGEQPQVEDYVARHPEIGTILQQVLPSLMLMRMPASAEKPADAEPEVCGVLGDYRILREIGRGGMGVVYQAKQVSLGRKVALKVLPFAATLDHRQLQRFHNEARAAACLHHPNIVPVYAVGCKRGVHYYAMQFIEGQSLEALIQALRQEKKPASSSPSPPLEKAPDTNATVLQPKANGKVAATQAETKEEIRANASTLQSLGKGRDYFRRIVEFGIQAAEALEHAHQAGVIHRDIKPGNLMLDNHGNLWITDFGLAQIQSDTNLTMTGDLIGTLRYMSPEQALAKRVVVDHRTDIYSLGATLYELLTLKPVFSGNDRQELLRQIAFEEPTALRKVERRIPVELETVILKALEKNPQERYGTAKELAGDLKRFMNEEPTLARRPGMLMRARKWGRRHVAAVRAASVAILATLVMAGAMMGWWLRDRSDREIQTERAVSALITEAEKLQSAGKMPDALAKVKQAAAIMASGSATPDVQKRVNSRLRDLQLVAELEEIRAERANALTKSGWDNAAIDQRYVTAFETSGIDVIGLPPVEAAKRIGELSVAMEVAAGLDYWCFVAKLARPDDKARWKQLLAVARVVDPDAIRNLVREYMEQGDIKALKARVGSLQLEKSSPATIVAVAIALDDCGSTDEAAEFLRRAQPLFSNDFWVNYQLARTLQKQAFPPSDYATPVVQESPMNSDIIRFWSIACALRPESAPARAALGGALIRTGKFDEAIVFLRDALRLKKDYVSTHFQLAQALSATGKTDEGIAEFREVLRLDPDNRAAQINIGIYLERMGRLDKAITEFRAAILRKPNVDVFYSRLAGLLIKSGELDEAITVSRKAILLNPESASAHNSLGNALRQKGQLDEAITAYKKAILFKEDSEVVHTNLGVALAQNGQQDEAISAFRKAIELKQDYAQAHNALAWLFVTCEDLRFRDPKAALESASRAVTLQPKNAAVQNTLGVAYYRNDEWRKAIDHLNQSLKLGGTHLAADYFFLAMSHWKLGDKDQARTWYDKGVQWMDKNRAKNAAELDRFRTEAAELLGIEAPKGKDKGG